MCKNLAEVGLPSQGCIDGFFITLYVPLSEDLCVSFQHQMHILLGAVILSFRESIEFSQWYFDLVHYFFWVSPSESLMVITSNYFFLCQNTSKPFPDLPFTFLSMDRKDPSSMFFLIVRGTSSEIWQQSLIVLQVFFYTFPCLTWLLTMQTYVQYSRWEENCCAAFLFVITFYLVCMECIWSGELNEYVFLPKKASWGVGGKLITVRVIPE